MIKSTFKTGSNETMLLISVPDALLDTVAHWYTNEYNRWAFANAATVDYSNQQAAQRPRTVNGMTNDIKNLHEVSQVGEKMKPSQIERVIEVLGHERATAIFGPGWSWDGFKIFQIADPLRLVRDGVTGKWVQQENKEQDEDFLSALMAYDITQWVDEMSVVDEDNEFAPTPDTEQTPQEIVERIRALSYSGNVISPAQGKFLAGVIKGAGKFIFPGGKQGAGNEAVNLYARYCAKRIREGQVFTANPNYSAAVVKYVEDKLRGG